MGISAITMAAALGLVAHNARAADPACPFGVNAHQASNQALDLASAAGISWVRFDMNWLQFEPNEGDFQWSEADRFVEHASALGLHVYMTLAYTPAWAVGAPCNDADENDDNWCHNAPPASSASWTTFVTAAVNRYGDRVKAWGMWNEPNLGHFFRGTRDDYVNVILVPGSAAVHAACSDCQVMGPELANLRSTDWDSDEGECYPGLGCRYNAWEVSLTRILQAAGDSIDVVTHHKYENPATKMWEELADGAKEGPLEVNHGLKTVLDGVAPNKPLWITEFGWETPPFGDNPLPYAAQQLTESYQGFRAIKEGTQPDITNQPWTQLDKLFWYDLHDDPSAASWGLLDSTLTPKDAYQAYADVVSAWGPCSSGTGGTGQGGSAGSAQGGSGQGGHAGGSAGSGQNDAGMAGRDAAAAGASTGGSGMPTDGGSNLGADAADDSGCGCHLPSGSPKSAVWLLIGAAALAMRIRRAAVR